MSLGTPAAFFWLALAIPIIALYIMKVRLRRVPVSTNLFWKQVYDEKPPRSLWQYLRHVLSLLLQLILLLLLISALADPYLPWQLSTARRIVLVVDQSASMQAGDVSPSRFEAARTAATDYINGLREHDQMAIVAAGSRPVVAVGMNNHAPTLHRSLQNLQPTDAPARLTDAIELARRLIGDHSAGQIVVLTDAGLTSAASPELTDADPTPDDSTSAPTVEYRVFATDAGNLGITQLQVRRSLLDPLGYDILLQVRNASSQPVECRLELELDGAPVDILPLQLTAEETWSRSLEKTSLEGGLLTARLTSIQAGENENGQRSSQSAAQLNRLHIDDTAQAILPARSLRNVLLVTPGNLFLQKVFEANPLVKLQVTRELPKDWPDEATGQQGLVVLHQLVPDQMPPGNVLVVDPADSSDLWTLNDTLTDPIVTDQDETSPLMTHIRLDNVVMPQARQISTSQSHHVLAASVSGDPVYLEIDKPTGRCLLLTTNLEESDLAFRTTFPVMVANALSWYAGEQGELAAALASGTSTTVPLPAQLVTSERSPTASQLTLQHPDGSLTELAVSEVTSSLPDDAGTPPRQTTPGPLQATGLYHIYARPADASSSSAEPLATLAVNLCDPRETDLRPNPDITDAGKAQLATAGWLSRPFWFYLALLGTVLTVTEWCLYQRRLTD